MKALRRAVKACQSPHLTLPLWAAVGAALVAASARPWLALAGLAAWPLVEYAGHRWGMHGLERWPALYGPAHGRHHDHPRDPSHYPIPVPVVALAVALALAIGAPPPAVGGLLLGLTAYDLCHLACHGLAPFPARAWFARHHARHHADQGRAFAVSAPPLDRLAGTHRPSGKGPPAPLGGRNLALLVGPAALAKAGPLRAAGWHVETAASGSPGDAPPEAAARLALYADLVEGDGG